MSSAGPLIMTMVAETSLSLDTLHTLFLPLCHAHTRSRCEAGQGIGVVLPLILSSLAAKKIASVPNVAFRWSTKTEARQPGNPSSKKSHAPHHWYSVLKGRWNSPVWFVSSPCTRKLSTSIATTVLSRRLTS